MATGAYDLTQTQPQRAAALGIPIDCLAVYCGISETRLRGLLNGRRVSNETMLFIRDRLDELESLKRRMWPIPIDFKNVQAVKELLKRLRNGFCWIRIVNSEIPESVKLLPEPVLQIPNIEVGIKTLKTAEVP